jgi:hypothetical protein
MNDPAFRRWGAIMAVRLVATAGAVFGVVLLGRATALGPRLLGLAIVVAALWVIATVPRALAHRWRSPE